MTNRKRYVLLPPRGLSASRSRLSAHTAPFFLPLNNAAIGPMGVPGTPPGIKVLDSIHEDGAKLVEMSESEAAQLRAEQPGIRILPEVFYTTADRKGPRIRRDAQPAAAGLATAQIRVRVLDRSTGQPVRGANVIAFTDFAARSGAQSVTGSDGVATLALGGTTVPVERFYVYPPLAGYWGAFEENVSLTSQKTVQLRPIDLTYTDSLRHFYGLGADTDGQGVRVAVLDTGVGPHPDLAVTGDTDNGQGHGSHVAGIIASRGSSPTGIRGLAPAAEVYSYRVFSSATHAANFDIAKAIDQAVTDGCDLINLSLKIDDNSNPSGFYVDPVVEAAIQDARAAGVLPIAAAGNDYRTVVDFPGRDELCIAVSALGRIGTFPADSLEEADVESPSGTDPNDFIAAFSNVGPEVDVTAPGVGIISTVPGGFGVMSGTSMACPAVTGIAARVLARNPAVLTMARDAQRASEIARLVLHSVRTLGFPQDLEGLGLETD